MEKWISHLHETPVDVLISEEKKKGEIVESLLDLIDVADCIVVGLVISIDEIFCKHGLLIASLRGQGYDGCVTMAGRYNGVQNLIKKQNPKAYFVHC